MWRQEIRLCEQAIFEREARATVEGARNNISRLPSLAWKAFKKKRLFKFYA